MTDVLRDLPRDERPRERLIMHGPELLSDAELLAVLLGSGVRGKNAVQLGRELLRNGIDALKRRDVGDLKAICGVGDAKAARIAAAFEISRRQLGGKPKTRPHFDARRLGQSLVMQCAQYRQERLGAAFLDARQRVMQEREIYIGTIDRTLVSTRDVVRHAVLDCASGVVIWHNHPSGDPTPSEEDTTFTQKLRESLVLVDVELLDHLVIGVHGYCSMKERGMF